MTEQRFKDKNAPELPPENVLSTMTAEGERIWVYPTLSKGRWLTRRAVVAYGLMAIFFLLPTIHIGDAPAIFLDVASRKFHFFGVTLFATDTLLLMLSLICSLVFIVLVTAVFGRAWCGWACPQTVYLEFLYRPIERLVEGKESARKRRDAKPWSFDKVWRKTLKWTLFTIVALLMAHNFVAYFVSWESLLSWMTGAPSAHWGIFLLMAATTGLILFDFGFFREQMCTIACPYARIQSVLLDRNSMIVSYDPGRGEPRGRRSRKQREQEKQGEPTSLGDCIDCGACVRTCPTGIDIREGLQMECINCTQCIDACDQIMISVDKPVGLIRYSSENEIEDKPSPILRPRVYAYVALITALLIGFGFAFTARGADEIEIIRSVGAPFQTLPDGQIANRLKLRVQNRDSAKHSYTIAIQKPEGSRLRVAGRSSLTLEPEAMGRMEVWVTTPPHAFKDGEIQGHFLIKRDDGETFEQTYRLIGPLKNTPAPKP